MTAILIGGEKGGTGKSTLSTNLAIMASLMGKDVLLLDTDKQATSAKFISKRNDKKMIPTPPCAQSRGKSLHRLIEDLCARYEVIIIDAGGQDSVELRASMASQAVEKIYTPLEPSEFSLATFAKMDELTYMAQSYNPRLKAFLLFNRTPTHPKIRLLDESMESLKGDAQNIQILDINISHRVPFQYAPHESMSVVEFELDRIESLPAYQAKGYQPKASQEICALYKHVFGEDFGGKITEYFDKPVEAQGMTA